MTFFGFSEGVIRLTVFISIFLVMALAEIIVPRKNHVQKKSIRWVTNWGLVIIDSVVLRVFAPILAVGVALYAESKGWGFFAITKFPLWFEFILAIILLDLAIYGQHVASHKIPVLWRFHKVHHADRDIDVTTGARFHPIEIVFSMGYKLICVLLIGPAAFSVFVFEVLLNASAMFNHSNIKLPLGVDSMLRKLIVTPDMHRVHHSIIPEETDSNYSFFLSVWDHIFKTYQAQPKDGHDGMTIGLKEYQTDEPSSLLWSLMLPFKRTPDNGK